jgi:GTP-binding protein
VTQQLQTDKEKTRDTAGNRAGIPIAIIGKPNAGKSTLLNKIVGEELSKVENIPNTTRDYIIANITHKNKLYTFYDTAGISKKGKMHELVKISYNKTMDMIKYIRPIIVYMIDATEGISHRDMTIFQEVQIQALPIMFCINKTDLVDKKTLKKIEATVVANLDFAKYIPVINISAKTGVNIDKIFDIAKDLKKESEKRVDTGKLNKIISEEYISRPPRFPRNKICKILYITQTDINAPTFVAFINHKDRANFAFKKWLENSIRKHFQFIGTPIVIKFKDRAEKREEKELEEKEEAKSKESRIRKVK